MADSQAFTVLCEALERASSFDRLEARGTVRLALKNAGLESSTVTAAQLNVVVDKILPAELETRGVDKSICTQLHSALDGVAERADARHSPEAVFSRLGS
jgi:hypothetical protein